MLSRGLDRAVHSPFVDDHLSPLDERRTRRGLMELIAAVGVVRRL